MGRDRVEADEGEEHERRPEHDARQAVGHEVACGRESSIGSAVLFKPISRACPISGPPAPSALPRAPSEHAPADDRLVLFLSVGRFAGRLGVSSCSSAPSRPAASASSFSWSFVRDGGRSFAVFRQRQASPAALTRASRSRRLFRACSCSLTVFAASVGDEHVLPADRRSSRRDARPVGRVDVDRRRRR